MLNGEHLLPAERPYSWLGSFRPSEAAAGLVAKLGDELQAASLGRLHTLQVPMLGFCQSPCTVLCLTPKLSSGQAGRRPMSAYICPQSISQSLSQSIGLSPSLSFHS